MRKLTWIWGLLGLVSFLTSSFLIIWDFFELAVIAMRLILPFLNLLRLVYGYDTFLDDNWMEISLLQGRCKDFEVAREPTAGSYLWVLLQVPMEGEVLIAYVHFKLITGQGAVDAAQD